VADLSGAGPGYEVLLSQLRQDLDEVEAALARLEDGSYGRCEVCGEALTPDALQGSPTLRRCPHCAGIGAP